MNKELQKLLENAGVRVEEDDSDLDWGDELIEDLKLLVTEADSQWGEKEYEYLKSGILDLINQYEKGAFSAADAEVEESFRTPMDVDKEASAKWRGEAPATSEPSTSMTGQEFEFALRGGTVTLLQHHTPIVSIPKKNWEALMRAYQQYRNRGHNY